MTFASKVIRFNKQLHYTGDPLPAGIRIMNPFMEPGGAMKIVTAFYKKYYSDNKQRHIILGINPGRFGAGLTGIPFTDPKRLVSECNIEYKGKITHEPSSVFVYEVIKRYGGPEAFYKDFYINSVCPLGFTSINKGKEKNYNYYDNRALQNTVTDFIIESIRKHTELPVSRDLCFCFGTGKNEKFLDKLNDEYGFFKKIVALEHPRFIMQYKSRDMERYIDKYMAAFTNI